jgi:hypothetical protein
MKITSNGLTVVPLISGRDYSVFIGGQFDGATVELTLRPQEGASTGIAPFPEHATITELTTFVFTAPLKGMGVDISGGGGGLSLFVEITPCAL